MDYIKAPLTINDTNFFKGLAIVLLLTHHLFYQQTGMYNDVFLFTTNKGINLFMVQEIGRFAKLSVALFVFLSGYGLAAQTEARGRLGDLKSFYIKRCKKFYSHYWFYWLTFVPISVLVFGYGFNDAYKSYIALNLVTDIFGVHNLFFPNDITLSYNPSWWFCSCIIVLYILYPFLYKGIKNHYILLLLSAIAFSFLPQNVLCIDYYIIAFILGIWMAISKIAPPRKYRMFLVLLLICFCVERVYNAYTSGLDSLIIICMIFVYQSFNIPDIVKKTISFLGYHSRNLFFFHVFILWWFKDFIYCTHNPFIILSSILIICLPISILINLARNYIFCKIER